LADILQECPNSLGVGTTAAYRRNRHGADEKRSEGPD
jgi:hypothetical protein